MTRRKVLSQSDIEEAKRLKNDELLSNRRIAVMRCQKCHITNNLHIISHRQTADGIRFSYMCRKCETTRMKLYRLTENGRKKINNAVKKSTKKHKEKQRARQLLGYNIKTKKIIKPKICFKCKKNKKLEGHHEDYSKPLDVIWVCRQCHCTYYK